LPPNDCAWDAGVETDTGEALDGVVIVGAAVSFRLAAPVPDPDTPNGRTNDTGFPKQGSDAQTPNRSAEDQQPSLGMLAPAANTDWLDVS
jgi:hypothetical protein